MPEIRLVTLDPGHFHAALIQKEMYPGVAARVDVYAPHGWDLDEHLKRVAAYNKRAEKPTTWRMELHTGADFFERMLVHTKLNVIWDWEAPPGGGDAHFAFYRGTRARIEVRQTAADKYLTELFVVPAAPALRAEVLSATRAALARLGTAQSAREVLRHHRGDDVEPPVACPRRQAHRTAVTVRST